MAGVPLPTEAGVAMDTDASHAALTIIHQTTDPGRRRRLVEDFHRERIDFYTAVASKGARRYGAPRSQIPDLAQEVGMLAAKMVESWDPSLMKFEAMLHDLETDPAVSARVRRMSEATKAFVTASLAIDEEPMSAGLAEALAAPPTGDRRPAMLWRRVSPTREAIPRRLVLSDLHTRRGP